MNKFKMGDQKVTRWNVGNLLLSTQHIAPNENISVTHTLYNMTKEMNNTLDAYVLPDLKLKS